MKAVHFGGGNIGRGFIGLLLSQAGYQVEFVDVNEKLVQLINEKGQYTVELASETADTSIVRNVTAINGSNKDLVAEAVSQADLVTTAVGVSVLKHIAPAIAEGITKRLNRSAKPLAIIACENTIGGSTQLKGFVYGHLTDPLKEKAEGRIVFPDAAVDRIVPIQQNEDQLKVIVEPFYEWVIDRSAMYKDFAEIPGVHYVDQLQPYIERKLFTVNTGHCCAAYHGYLNGCETIQEVMQNPELVEKVRGALGETGAVLIQEFGFNHEEHETYINKILDRFRNPYLTDEVVRVGRSPIRKLSPNDRLTRPAALAHSYHIDVPYLTEAMAAAMLFDYEDDPEAMELQNSIQDKGIAKSITMYTELESGNPLHEQILTAYNSYLDNKTMRKG